MATTKEAAPRFARAWGIPDAFAKTTFRFLREKGEDLMLEAGRGNRGRHLAPRHASNAMLALLLATPTRAAATVRRYRCLVPGSVANFQVSSDGSVRREGADQSLVDLLPPTMTQTLGHMLDGLVEGAAVGLISGDERPFDVQARIQHGARIAAEIRFTDRNETTDEQGQVFRRQRRISYGVAPSLFTEQVDTAPEQFVVLRHEHFEFAGELARESLRQSEIDTATPQNQISEAFARAAAAARETGSSTALPKKRKAVEVATPTAFKPRRRPTKAAPPEYAHPNEVVAEMQVSRRPRHVGRLLDSKGESPDGSYQPSSFAA